ncbi:PDDEXK nuclease domain-containing protein [Ruminococcaceae bacterium OttesenSCG-928-I18]|nr:PDDEXK nuclease domain-containing protein [Ruminococcaceae bacterium OttesenSCG-928-I18]
MAILTAAKTDEEREFYVRLCIKEKYSARELQRQLDSGYYHHRYVLSEKAQPPALVTHNANARFLDSYVLEFLDLPDTFSERDLKYAIVQNLKNFVLEIGRDFAFIGEEHRVQVGDTDFYIDLLFYHRGLSCLVDICLNFIGRFEVPAQEVSAEELAEEECQREKLERHRQAQRRYTQKQEQGQQKSA